MDVTTPSPTVQRTAHGRPSRLRRRRNVAFFLLDTAFFFFALSLVDASSVLTSLVSHLTTLPVFIGLIGSAQSACWLLPQLLIARIVAGRRRKLPIVLVGSGLSRLSWLLLLAALAFPGLVSPTVTLLAVFSSIALFFFFDGVAVLAWYDLVSRAVPANVRGRMFGLMSLSGVFGLAGGLVVHAVIGSARFPYPSDYRSLVFLALLAFAIGFVPLAFVEESEGEVVSSPEPLGPYLRRLPGLLRLRPWFRRVVVLQLLVGASALAVPFFAPFAVEHLTLPESDVGTFVVGSTLGSIVGGFAFGFLIDHGRKDAALRALLTFALLAPMVALILAVGRPLLPEAYESTVLTLAMFAVGCSTRSSWVVFASYLMDTADERERPILIGLTNTLSGSLAIMPPLGGLLAGALGYEATFAVATIPAAAGLVLSLRLPGRKSVEAK